MDSRPTIAVITAPDEPVPSLVEVKDHLGVDFADDDGDILSKIWGAITEFEDPDLGQLGRTIIPRRLELRASYFANPLYLPRGPVLLGEDYPFEVVYDDADGIEQTVSPDSYRLLDPEGNRTRICLKVNETWPSTSGEDQCVRVRYWAGYDPEDVRINNFKSAVKLHVGMTYDEAAADREKLAQTISSLLSIYWRPVI